MATFREVPCKYYVAKGVCKKGWQASYKGYCQHCGKYEQRAKGKLRNRKKEYNEKIRGKSGLNQSPDFLWIYSSMAALLTFHVFPIRKPLIVLVLSRS